MGDDVFSYVSKFMTWRGIMSLGLVWLFAMNTLLVYNLQGRSTLTSMKEEELQTKERELSIWRYELEQLEVDLRNRSAGWADDRDQLMRAKVIMAELERKVSELGGDENVKTTIAKIQQTLKVTPAPDLGSSESNINVDELTGQAKFDAVDFFRAENPGSDFQKAHEWFQKEIERVQNPEDCSKAKYMYCHQKGGCGAGCSLHQLAYCFYVGMKLGRVTVLSEGWHYLSEVGGQWDYMFEPMTRCKYDNYNGGSYFEHNREKALEDTKVLYLGVYNRPWTAAGNAFVPWATTDGEHTGIKLWKPEEWGDTLRNHADFRLWTVGHLEQYMMRLNDKSKKYMYSIGNNANISAAWKHPTVGVHVRRTDHGGEAPFRQLSEYLVEVESWWKQHNVPQSEKRIYLATDEPAVWQEAITQHPQIQWFTFQYGDHMSGGVAIGDRTKMDSTWALFSDWKWLSSCDFFVGTMSSQVGRMAVEWMQTRRENAGHDFKSLDDPWYFP